MKRHLSSSSLTANLIALARRNCPEIFDSAAPSVSSLLAPAPEATVQVQRSQPTPPSLVARPADDAPPARVVQTVEQVVQRLTTCLENSPCSPAARRIFRTLFRLALEVSRVLGHHADTTQTVYHVPAELVMAQVNLKKSAFYEHLKRLRQLGLVACEAHMGDLRGRSVATGTLWAISLQPARVLAGRAAPVRIRREDWGRQWRDLNADVKARRTAYALLYPRGRCAGGSRNAPEAEVTLAQLKHWALNPFHSPLSDTLTVRARPEEVQNVVWALGDAARARRHHRAAIVDRQARTLAAAFADGPASLGFWRRLIWDVTRGIDAGEDVSSDVGEVLARVLRDVEHDLNSGGTPPRRPAAVATAALGQRGLLDHLRTWAHRTVGSRPPR